MTATTEYQDFGEVIRESLALKFPPLAIKLIESETDIPETALRPKKDRGTHFALCQAFALSRREGMTVAMLKEDSWCWAPLISFGMVETPEFNTEEKASLGEMAPIVDSIMDQTAKLPKVELGKYIGVLSAPLTQTSFEPDVALIYCNPGQIRALLTAVVGMDAPSLKSEFDPYDSCVYAILPTMRENNYKITMPDPGEYERALVGEDKVIFSVPQSKLGEVVEGLKRSEKFNGGYRQRAMQMSGDFPRPPFYDLFFKKWGID